MSVAIPTTEPKTFRAGDLLSWSKSLSDFPANAGWALAYTFINATQKLTINAGASGADFLVSVSAATTAPYIAGTYSWMARVSKGTEIYTVDSGTTEILPNLATATTYDGRTHAKKMLEAIEAAYEGRASLTQMQLQINGRSVQEFSRQELITWRSYYKAEVAQQGEIESIGRTGHNPRHIKVRSTKYV